ncbi:MAG: HlyD family efflux transporter periplasmic adaptor subunit [Butyrivibrio sp.]|nr:HlyD family efflux transporter periplasmic adaptor subunit [Butyrivibrio sp.]
MSEIDVQEKKANKRKDLIKDFAIAFLAIMLVLTFFSNTIMNYTLPEVATQMVQSGKVSPKIRGTGTVEAEDPYSVMISETRKISSVAVKVGDHVNKDDVIYYLEDKESTELEEARTKLEEAQKSYELALLDGTINNDVINRVRSGKTVSIDEYQAQLKAINDKYQAAVQAQAEEQLVLDYLTAEKEKIDSDKSYNDLTPKYMEYQNTYDLAILNAEIENLNSEIEVLYSERDKYNSNSTEYKNIQDQIDDKSNQIATKRQEIEDINNNTILDTKDNGQLSNYAAQMAIAKGYDITVAKAAVDKATAEVEKITAERTALLNSISAEIKLDYQRDDIFDQKEKLEKLEANAVGATINSPVDGTISSLSLVAGESTKTDSAVAVIQIDGKAMTTSFSVSTTQAKKLKVGDIAEPQNAWYYSDFKATLSAIKNDSSDPANKKSLVFTIESPEVNAGQSISLQIGESSSSYDFTVPNSAIRQDSNGKFILIVNQKSSPLGNRYVASRVDVEVLASDDTTSAISASLEGYEYVITTTTSPITAGQQVRLSNSNS